MNDNQLSHRYIVKKNILIWDTIPYEMTDTTTRTEVKDS